MRGYLTTHLLEVAKAFPDTEFDCIVTPYFRWRFADWRQNSTDLYALHQFVTRFLVDSGVKNIRVYGYENETFLDDIANFKDVTHYSPAINTILLQGIASGKNLLTKENVKSYLSKCEKLAREYDIAALNRQFQLMVKAVK